MSGVAITVDAAPVLAYLRILSRKMDDMTPVMRAIGNIIANQADEAFENQASPAGAPWKPLKQGTILARTRRVTGEKTFRKNGNLTKRAASIAKGAQILIDHNTLRNSLTVEATGNSVTVGYGTRYAAIHQLGGATGRGHRTILPARPFLPDDASLDFDEITDVITRYLNT